MTLNSIWGNYLYKKRFITQYYTKSYVLQQRYNVSSDSDLGFKITKTFNTATGVYSANISINKNPTDYLDIAVGDVLSNLPNDNYPHFGITLPIFPISNRVEVTGVSLDGLSLTFNAATIPEGRGDFIMLSPNYPIPTPTAPAKPTTNYYNIFRIRSTTNTSVSLLSPMSTKDLLGLNDLTLNFSVKMQGLTGTLVPNAAITSSSYNKVDVSWTGANPFRVGMSLSRESAFINNDNIVKVLDISNIKGSTATLTLSRELVATSPLYTGFDTVESSAPISYAELDTYDSFTRDNNDFQNTILSVLPSNSFKLQRPNTSNFDFKYGYINVLRSIEFKTNPFIVTSVTPTNITATAELIDNTESPFTLFSGSISLFGNVLYKRQASESVDYSLQDTIKQRLTKYIGGTFRNSLNTIEQYNGLIKPIISPTISSHDIDALLFEESDPPTYIDNVVHVGMKFNTTDADNNRKNLGSNSLVRVPAFDSISSVFNTLDKYESIFNNTLIARNVDNTAAPQIDISKNIAIGDVVYNDAFNPTLQYTCIGYLYRIYGLNLGFTCVLNSVVGQVVTVTIANASSLLRGGYLTTQLINYPSYTTGYNVQDMTITGINSATNTVTLSFSETETYQGMFGTIAGTVTNLYLKLALLSVTNEPLIYTLLGVPNASPLLTVGSLIAIENSLTNIAIITAVSGNVITLNKDIGTGTVVSPLFPILLSNSNFNNEYITPNIIRVDKDVVIGTNFQPYVDVKEFGTGSTIDISTSDYYSTYLNTDNISGVTLQTDANNIIIREV